MDSAAMMFFVSNATDESWVMMGYGYLITGAIVAVFLVGVGIYSAYDYFIERKLKRIRIKIIETIVTGKRHKELSRDSLWGCNDGRRIKIKDLEDTHVANIIDWALKTGYPESKLIRIMKKELKIRGISHKFSDRSQIPYKNQSGKWEIWNFDTNEPMELEA